MDVLVSALFNFFFYFFRTTNFLVLFPVGIIFLVGCCDLVFRIIRGRW